MINTKIFKKGIYKMKIYSLNTIPSKITRQKENKNRTSTYSYSYSNIIFSGKKNLVKPVVVKEESKKILSKMQFLDKIIPNYSKTFEPIPLFSKSYERKTQRREIKFTENIDYSLIIDKTKDEQCIYTFMEHIKNPWKESNKEGMKLIFDPNGQMVHGQINHHSYTLSFERDRRNVRRLKYGGDMGTTTFAPAENYPSVWAQVASHSDYNRKFSEVMETIHSSSEYSELFMELTKLNTSIK